MEKTLPGSAPCWGWSLCPCGTSSAPGTARVCSSAGLSHTTHPGKIASLLSLPLWEVQASSLLSPWPLCPLIAFLFPGQKHSWTLLCWMSPSHWTHHPDHVVPPRASLAALGKFYTNTRVSRFSSSASLTQSHSPFYSFKKELSRSKNLGEGEEDLEKKKENHYS